MYQSGYRHVRIFAARIGHVVRGCPGLLDPRNDLTPDWILGIAPRQEVKKVWRDREREFVAREQNATTFLVTQLQVFFQLSQRGDPVLELPFPIVPKFRRDPAVAGPIARRVRDELFSVPFF